MVVLAGLRTRWTTLVGSFVALALGVGLIATTALGLAAALDPPVRQPEGFAASPVVVMGTDTLTVGRKTQKLFHPQPVDKELVRELRTLGPVQGGGNAVGVDAPADRVRAMVGHRAQVLTGDARRRADPAAARDEEAVVTVVSVLGTSGGVAAFVSVFVVASTFAFSVALRRREFGLLRTAGATPGQVRRLVMAEAGVVGVVAAAAGCALGEWCAPLLARRLVGAGMAPEWFAIGEQTWPLQLAFWTGLLVAMTGAWTASRRAGRIGPVEALREASVDEGVMPWSRKAIGAALLAGGIGLIGWTLASDPSELLHRKTYMTQPMVLITGAALLTPLVVGRVARALRLPGAVGMLVRENTAASVRRTAAIAAPVLMTVALAGTVMGATATKAEAKAAEARARTHAQLIVTGEDLKVPSHAIRGATLTPSASTGVFTLEDGVALVKSEARAVPPGTFPDLDDHSIVVNEEWAQHNLGERVTLWLGDGRKTSLRIVGVQPIGTGDNGAYVTPANGGPAPVDRIEVTLRPGADRAAVTAELRKATGGEVRTKEEWLRATHPRTNAQTRLGLWVVLGIALLYTAIGLANTLVMAGSVRKEELRSLGLAGATRTQVLRVTAGEAVLAVGIGAVLGAAVTALNLAGVTAALSRLSAPTTVVVPWQEMTGAAGVCATIALLMSLLTRFGSRRAERGARLRSRRATSAPRPAPSSPHRAKSSPSGD
ncbi:ABC transporter permease [Streptomyces sp. NBC_01465]|uniref:ABC transporter permease n=1 Tax=Streptomyces sp. NBC_01465 TaxID=2903878 RepID=UPI002E2F2B05|nr:FtsX-like permease family protein [Streptomyces sp. NBC_01465]